MTLDPRDVIVGDDGADSAGELGRSLVRGITLEHACLGFDHLGERPEGHALAVRQRATLAPANEIPPFAALEEAEELVDEPALADPGDSDECHELRGPFVDRAIESSAQR